MGSKHSKNKKKKSIHKAIPQNSNKIQNNQSLKKRIIFNYKGNQKVISYYN